MGVQLSKIITGKPIMMRELKGKTLAVDAFNTLYQFLTTIRGPDGSPLTDSKGRITSHLVGLFSRTSKLMEEGIKLVFVFDGKAPELKKKERERRALLKEKAKQDYEEAKAREDIEGMAKYASRTAVLTKEMIKEAKELLKAMGLPYVEAPSEGEAQAAHIVKKGEAWALISQDYDCLLFGTPRMIKNLSITQRKRKPGSFATTIIEPELITLEEVLNNLGITQEQLITLGMLVGTDFNIGGIKGLGPKKSLKLVKELKTPEKIFQEAKWNEYFDTEWQEIMKLFKKMPVTNDYKLEWKGIDKEAIIKILVEEHDFGKQRVLNTIEKLIKTTKDRSQKGLSEFF